jgi:hypothetical protein
MHFSSNLTAGGEAEFGDGVPVSWNSNEEEMGVNIGQL